MRQASAAALADNDWKETETFRKLYLEAKNVELELMLDETLK